MAHKKGTGTSRNGRDSIGKRLGCKRFDGMIVTAGTILVRQRGTKFHYTLFAKCDGEVKYTKSDKRRVHIIPLAEMAETVAVEETAE